MAESDKEKLELSRRDFIKTVGVGAGVLAVGQIPVRGSTIGSPEILGPGLASLKLKVNGREHILGVEPRTTLLNALRNHLDITGPKEVCERGACGACTVWVDGKIVNSCLMLAFDAQGKEITTVEGLSKDDKLHPVQSAFVKCDGLQCGFCTPGFIMSISACLKNNPKASLDEIKQSCRGNICRCGSYMGIFNAALAVTKGEHEEQDVSKLSGDELKKYLEEKGFPRVDGPAKVKGAAKYTYDVKMKNMLYVRTLDCQFDSASIVGDPKIDEANKIPGVKFVEVSKSPKMGPYAFAVAEDPQAADEALATLGIKLDPKESATAVTRDFKPKPDSSPKDRIIVIQTIQHSPLEPHGAAANFEGKDLTVYESTQGVSSAQKALKAPGGKARLICEYMGGGFGCKAAPWSGTPRAVNYAKSLSAPVKYMSSRAVELMLGGGRKTQIQKYSIKDGKVDGPKNVSFSGKGYGPAPILRAPGIPQRQFIDNIITDEKAFLDDKDPLDVFKVKGPRDLLDDGAKAIGWDKRQKKPGSAPGPLKRGIGIGTGNHGGAVGCDFAQVEVDVETGVVRVIKVVAVVKGGYMNRRLVESQIFGGTIMGMSWAMFEQRVMDRNYSAMLNVNLETYKIAGSLDIPEIQIILHGRLGGTGGMGEQPVTPIGGAIANAIFNATGVRVTQMPFTPENVLAAIEYQAEK